MGLIKSFVNAFLIFWASFLFVIFMLDIRAVILRELPPLVTYQFTAELLLDSLISFFLGGFSNKYLIGLITLVFASLLIGMVSDSYTDAIFSSMFFILITLILSLPFYQIAQGLIGGDNSYLMTFSSRVPKGFLNMIITIVFSIIGKALVREEKPPLLKEIDFGRR